MTDHRTSQLTTRYNAHAAAYVDLWASLLRIASGRLICELAGTHVEPVRLIADVGAGAGTLMPDLLAAFPGASVLGLDRSPGMLAHAPRDRGMLHAVCDARHLPLASATCDLVIMAFILFHLPNPAEGLSEARRVLRPGGRIGTITWGATEFQSRAWSVWIECLDEHGATPLEQSITARDEPLNTGSKLEALLRTAGFPYARGWSEPLQARIEPDHLLQLHTRMGSLKPRFDSLTPDIQQSCLTTARRRMEALSSDDFVCRGDVVYAIAR